jgi:hypothetical protein
MNASSKAAVAATRGHPSRYSPVQTRSFSKQQQQQQQPKYLTRYQQAGSLNNTTPITTTTQRLSSSFHPHCKTAPPRCSAKKKVIVFGTLVLAAVGQ